ncbi:hypothetical protein GC209_03790 [bacterium]|nr:hypothetical protein [bacterium]
MKNVRMIRGVWVARIVVPQELRRFIGRSELQEKLPPEARARERQAVIVLNRFHALLDDAREKLVASRPIVASAAK